MERPAVAHPRTRRQTVLLMGSFFGIGPLELLVIAVLALIFIGPQRLPGVIQQVMSTLRELRGYADEVQRELSGEFAEMRDELTEVTRDVNQFAQDVAAQTNQVAAETQQVTREVAAEVQPALGSLTAPPPPLDTPPPVPAQSGISTNGAGHTADDEPVFRDYRPGS